MRLCDACCGELVYQGAYPVPDIPELGPVQTFVCPDCGRSVRVYSEAQIGLLTGMDWQEDVERQAGLSEVTDRKSLAMANRPYVLQYRVGNRWLEWDRYGSVDDARSAATQAGLRYRVQHRDGTWVIDAEWEVEA